MAISGSKDGRPARIRLGMVGGGRDAFIGAVHRIASRIDDRFELVAGAFSSTPEKSKASAADLGIANSLLALHAGMITSASQQFNVNSRTSGFVSGAPSAKQFTSRGLICSNGRA